MYALHWPSDVTGPVRVRNVEYSILFVMSELSTVQCDRALGLWIAGTRASSVDGELRVGAVADGPCGGRR